MNRFLSVLSLLVLSPTLIVFFPWVVGLALAIPSRLLVGVFEPAELIKMYHGKFSFGEAVILECLGAIWVLGYFAAIVVYIVLLLPVESRWGRRIWLCLVSYFCFVLGVRPWQRHIWEVKFSPESQTLFLFVSGALFLVALLGVFINARRLRSLQTSTET